MPTALLPFQSNSLLAALPGKDRQKVLEAATVVTLRGGTVLFDRGERVRHLHFPLRSSLSMLATADDHSMLQVAMIGGEGACGYSEILSAQVSPVRALVVGDCNALRVTGARTLELAESSTALAGVMTRYVSVRLAQLAQTVACTRFHVIEQRFARWLLMAHDRAHSDALVVTQEFLAYVLGVRRVGISAAAATFKTRGLIDYARGRLTVTDRKALEAESCTCYWADLGTYSRGMYGRRPSLKK